MPMRCVALLWALWLTLQAASVGASSNRHSRAGALSTCSNAAAQHLKGRPGAAFVSPCVHTGHKVTTRQRQTRWVARAHSRSPVAMVDRGDLPTAVVIIPGYATDASAYVPLQESIKRRGTPCWVAPVKWYMWLPTLGGRSIRPILDRVHETVLSVALEGRAMPPDNLGSKGLTIAYSWSDLATEMSDPRQGARPAPAYDFPASDEVTPLEKRRHNVALVAHSAGGWLSRIYLSNCEYDGMTYNGARFVHTLVTLGSPHVLPERFATAKEIPYALRNLKFVNEKCSTGRDWERHVNIVNVGSDTVRSGKLPGGFMRDMVGHSYELCGYDEEGITGDGITPLESALGMPNATHVRLEGVMHGPEAEGKGLKWYGTDPQPLETWLPFVLDAQRADIPQEVAMEHLPPDTVITLADEEVPASEGLSAVAATPPSVIPPGVPPPPPPQPKPRTDTRKEASVN